MGAVVEERQLSEHVPRLNGEMPQPVFCQVQLPFCQQKQPVSKDFLHVVRRERFPVHVCHAKAKAGKDLEVSEGHGTNRGYVIVPEPNKVSLAVQGDGGKEGGCRHSPLPHTFNMAKMSSSLMSHASGVGRDLFALLLSIPLTFPSRTFIYFFCPFALTLFFFFNREYLASSPFQSRPGNPDLIKL